MKIILQILCFIILFTSGISFTSCKQDEPTPPHPNRTILVYMVARNSLGTYSYDKNDLDEMLEAAKTQNGFNGGRLIVFHAPKSGIPQLKEVTANGIIRLKEYETSICCVEKSTMEKVINDTKKLAPANDYGLILWSHANGWLQTGIAESSSSATNSKTLKPTAFGDDNSKNMNITTLAEVLSNKNFSFIYFDCCYMACVEVAYEMRHTTPYIIASATELHADGMPYDKNLQYLFADEPQLQKACENTFDFYNVRNDETRTCTISLIKTDEMEQLANATRNIYATKTFADKSYIPQRFMTESRCFHFDLKSHIHSLPIDPALLTEWDNALDNVIVYCNNTPYIWNLLKINNHCGLSTYIIDDISDNNAIRYKYTELQWWKDVVSYRF